ncbi:MAG: DUF3343 domain-containing protein [Clostridia bacterium]|nr:DUF3343 domain-containing protein [Oscillospiraceae bacterium]MBR4892476.1 DUF3343 domain-containing protein [Clostridia bacterium]
MKYYIAVFSSITFANRIKKKLENSPGYITLMHTPMQLSEKGCSYSLRFKEDKLNSVIETAKMMNIKIVSIYTEDNNKYIKIQ